MKALFGALFILITFEAMGPIGVFDSGYGGLTVLKELVRFLPSYDYLYLGDNARAPYGTRSYETVYRYTLDSVTWLLAQGCPLVILACNTASAKALRTIQQQDLQKLHPRARVLGVIRPTAEIIGQYTKSGSIGIFATPGTVQSGSYLIEIEKYFPELQVEQEACPIWVPLIENNEHETEGADFFIRKHVEALKGRNKNIDTVLLACTHYPLLKEKLSKYLGSEVKVLSQGEIVAHSLQDYLKRHPEIESSLGKGGEIRFFTTDSPEDFERKGSIFYGESLRAEHTDLRI